MFLIFDTQVWFLGGQRGLRRVRFLKNDISFFILVISVSFWTPQAWNEEGAGLRRVRFLKNDMAFSILMISVSFWTPQAWNGGGAGLRRVRILKNDISFLILVISVSFSILQHGPQGPGPRALMGRAERREFSKSSRPPSQPAPGPR